MEIVLLEEKEYIPGWHNNKKEAKPISAILQPLTAGQRAVLIQKIADDEPDKDYLCYACMHGIKKINNLPVGGKNIETAEQLLNSRGADLELLILELGQEIIISNRRPDLKNS